MNPNHDRQEILNKRGPSSYINQEFEDKLFGYVDTDLGDMNRGALLQMMETTQ